MGLPPSAAALPSTPRARSSRVFLQVASQSVEQTACANGTERVHVSIILLHILALFFMFQQLKWYLMINLAYYFLNFLVIKS